MVDDNELLRRYVEEQSQTAFAELVARHIDLVYGAALRRVGGDAHSAHDVTQKVFITLARKAASVMRHPSLLGWLHTSTRYAATNLVREQQRRVAREQISTGEESVAGSEAPADWEQLRPWIDDALDGLGKRERAAVLMRFFAGQSWAQIGATLRVSEDAARKRVNYALERLRKTLARRGVTSSAVALGTALAQAPATVAAPAGLAGSIAAGAMSAAGGGATLGLGSALVVFMSTAKLNLGAGLLAAAAVATFLGTASIATLTWQEHRFLATERAAQAAQLKTAQDWIAKLRAQIGEMGQRVEAQKQQAEASARAAGAPEADKPARSTAPKLSGDALRFAVEDLLLADPDYRELARREYRIRAQKDFGAFIAAQQLPPENAEALRELLVQRMEARAERARAFARNGPPSGAKLEMLSDTGSMAYSVSSSDDPEIKVIDTMKTLLGAARFEEFKAYERLRGYSLPADLIALDLQDQQQALSTSQKQQLQQLLAETQTYPGAMGREPTETPVPTQAESAVVARAQNFLSPEQTRLFERHLVEQRVAGSLRNRYLNRTFTPNGPAGTAPKVGK
jgi:RNA polymerase sigma factor (sigma-70 family)